MALPKVLRPSPALPLLFALALLPGRTPARDGAPGEPHPTLEDLFTVVSLSDPQLSPDGRTLLYVVRTAELEENRTNADIWRVSLEEEAPAGPVRLTRSPKDDTRPRWRPDGLRFAFLSGREGEGDGRGRGPALYLMDPFGGEPELLYRHETGIRAFEWSPDGRRIAFTARDPESEEEKEAKKRGRDVKVEEEPGPRTHLWLVEVETREARRLTGGEALTVGSFAWSPDGRRIAFAATPTPRITDSWKSDLYLLDLPPEGEGEGQEPGELPPPRRLTTNPGPDQNPRWSPDGRHLYYEGYRGDGYRIGYNRTFRIPADGGEPEDVTPAGELDPGPYALTPDGTGAFFVATTGTVRSLFFVGLEELRPIRLTPGRGVVRSFALSRDARRVALVREAPDAPPEVYGARLRVRRGRPELRDLRALTEHNAHAAGWAVGRTEVLRWRSVDGREVEGLVVYPAGWTAADGPRAAVVRVHGGPAGVYTQTFQASWPSADAQLYAADGYAVFLPNPRGSSGYGDATVRAVIEDWGGLDFQDIMTGLDTLVARGVAHPDSLGVMGWSYGGYMTAWTVARTDRFQAAVAGAAITETIAMWGTHDILHVFEAYFGGSPYDPGRWEEYQASSPLAFIRNARTPTLILHGENDERVPPNQARLFFRALRANGVPTELVWLPRTGHGPREPGLQYERLRRQKEWMDRWIRGKTPAADGDGRSGEESR